MDQNNSLLCCLLKINFFCWLFEPNKGNVVDHHIYFLSSYFSPVMDLLSNLQPCCHDSCTVPLRDPETVSSWVFTGHGSQTDS